MGACHAVDTRHALIASMVASGARACARTRVPQAQCHRRGVACLADRPTPCRAQLLAAPPPTRSPSLSWTRRGWKERLTGAIFSGDSWRSGAPLSTERRWRRSKLASRWLAAIRLTKCRRRKSRHRRRRHHRASIAAQTGPSLRPRQAGSTPIPRSASVARGGPARGNARGSASAPHAQVACAFRRRMMANRGVYSTHRFDASNAIQPRRRARCTRGHRRFTVSSFENRCK